MAAVGGRPTTCRWCCSPPHLCIQFAVVLVLLVSTLSTARGSDTLLRGDSIRGDQTLVSAGDVFELGHFIPSTSSNNCYVGIWYKNVTVRTVVWVANREKPTKGCSGALAVDALGSVEILDGANSVVQVLGEVRGSEMVRLLDSGNLVVTAAGDSGQVVVWQSFDYPTDTWLPGMRLGRKGNISQWLTSWRSPADPSPGTFTLETDGPRLLTRQKEKGTMLWNSGGLANSNIFGLQPASNLWYRFGVGVFRDVTYNATSYDAPNEEYYFVYAAASPFTRLVMAPQGKLQQLTWDSPNWTVLSAIPRDGEKCGDAGNCGANGLCNSGGSRPTCKCLPGFDRRSPGSDGCSRRLPINCAGDGFGRLQGVIGLPLEPYSFDEAPNSNIVCGDRCQENCSCTAYASTSPYYDVLGCFMWFEEPIGVQEDYKNYTSEGVLYIRLAASEVNHTSNTSSGEIPRPPQGGPVAGEIPRPPQGGPSGSPDLPSGEPTKVSDGGPRKWPLKIALPIVVVLICGGAPLCCFLWRRCKAGGEANSEEQLLLRDIGRNGAATYAFVDANKTGSERGPEICVYRFSNVVAATDNFSDDKKLGQGGFGPVYMVKILLQLVPFSCGEDVLKAKNESSGYMSPEYAMEGRFSVKSDVFSFGVLIIEIVSGRKNVGSHHYFPDHGNLLSYAWDLRNAGEELALADPSLGGLCCEREVSKCIHVGLVCVQDRADDRPTMAEVVAMLVGESVDQQVPKQPAFFRKRDMAPAGGSDPAAADSANGMSMSTMEAR